MRRGFIAVLLLLALTVAIGCFGKRPNNSVTFGSVAQAYGFVAASRQSGPVEPVLYGSPPGYGLVLATLAGMNAGTSAALDCWRFATAETRICTSHRFGFVVFVQLLVALSTLLLALLVTWRLSGQATIALATLLLFDLATRPGEAAASIRPGVWYTFFLLLFLALSLEGLRRNSAIWTTASGAALGLAAVIEPHAVVLAPVMAVGLLMFGSTSSSDAVAARPAVMSAGLLVGTAATAIGCLVWASRHGYDPASVVHYQARLLSERMAFLLIDQRSWLASLLIPIPIIGDLIAGLLPDAVVRRLGASWSGSLTMTGSNSIYPHALAVSGGSPAAAIAWLLRENVVAHSVTYIVSIPPVLARGIWASGGIVALLGVFHVGTMLGFARAERRLAEHRLVLIPVGASLLTTTLLTENTATLNPLLPFVYAYAIAYVAAGW